MSLKVEIYFWSRDYRILFPLAALILLAGFLLALPKKGTQLQTGKEVWVPDEVRRIADPWEKLKETLKPAAKGESEKERIDGIVHILMALDLYSKMKGENEPRTRVSEIIAASDLSPARKQLVDAFWVSLGSLSGEPNALLLTLAYRQQLPNANYMTGWLYVLSDNFDRAIFFLRREGALPQSSEARKMLISTLLHHKDFKELEKLSADPRYAKEWSLHAEILLAMHKHEWFRASLGIGRQIFTEFNAAVAGLVLLSGSIWFLIWLQAIQVLEAPLARISLCVASFALGVLSVIPTLVLVYWSENDLGLTEGLGLSGDLLFFLAGVGPREELCKLLAVLPLIPFLLKRGNRLEVLVVAGFAGLGFAVEENFQYLSQHVAAAYARFLTANFFHVAATALIGLSLFESLTEPRRKWWVFPFVFLWVSFIHGAYDIFLSSPELGRLEGLSMVCFVWIGLVFFKRLRQARSLETNYFWISASVILGVATVSAATLVYTAEAVGLAQAIDILASQAFSLGMLIYFFVWQTGNLRYDADL